MNLPSNCHCTADVLFKLPALDQLFCPDEQDEGAVGRSQHTVDLVDADVAVLRCFSGGQCHFQMDRNGADAILYVKAPLKDQSDIEIITEKDYISHPMKRCAILSTRCCNLSK